MPSTPDAQLLEVEAEVLDHVVGRRVADHGRAGVQRGCHQRVLGHGVAALGEHDRASRFDGPVDRRVVHAVGGLDLEPERPQGRHVRLDGPGAEVAAAGVRQVEDFLTVQQRAEEHDDGAGTTGGRLVDVGQVELGRRDDLEVVLGVQPLGLDAERVQHLEQPVDLLDPGDPAQRRATAVEQRGAEQRDAGVLRRLDVDRAGQGGGAVDAKVDGSGLAERHDLRVEGLTDPRQHLQGEVLVALLDPVDRTLAGRQHVCELLLGPAAVLSRVTDQVADASEIVVGHVVHGISDMRYRKNPGGRRVGGPGDDGADGAAERCGGVRGCWACEQPRFTHQATSGCPTYLTRPSRSRPTRS